MLFSSLTFIFLFFPIVIVGYLLLSFSRTTQNIWLFLVSLVFYAWGQIEYLGILLASIVVNYILGLLIDLLRKKQYQVKWLYVMTWLMNMGILFVFKYMNFAVNNLNYIFGSKIYIADIVLPLGISFFTFQGMSYVIDVYNETVEVQKNFLNIGLYISFFPQLVAGPIVRYAAIADQIRNRKASFEKISIGTCRFVSGLGKKLVLANNFALIADSVYDLNLAGDMVSAAASLLGMVAYGLQIFFDFSAYSDMAIGLSLIFGFELEENFDYPYVSKSVSEFWRRWHISLTNWFKEYIYFPLGGSRVKNKDIMIRNVFIVWLCTGIWHGAAWTFIFWGLFNFAFIVLERLTKFENRHIPGIVKNIYLVVVIFVGWVFFRAESFPLALRYLKNLFCLNGNVIYDSSVLVFLKEFWAFLVVGVLLCMPIGRRMNRLLYDKKAPTAHLIYSILYPIGMLLLFLVCMSYLVKGSYNPFIYFNF